MENLAEFVSTHAQACVLLYKDNHDPSMQMVQVFKLIPTDFPKIAFTTSIEGNESHQFFPTESVAIPTVAFFEKGKKLGSLKDCIPQALLSALTAWRDEGADSLRSHLSSMNNGKQESNGLEDGLTKRLHGLINQSPVMVFMKGAKAEPFCRFSKQLVALFNEKGIIFNSFDVFEDNEVREGLKIYSDWPTFPQVYIKGEFIGGLDIIKGMDEDGTLLSTIPPENLSRK